MNVRGREMRTIWLAADGRTVEIIDQTKLPHELAIVRLEMLADAAQAISAMQVRGAPLIGATAAYGMALAAAEDPSDEGLAAAMTMLAATRPTAVNLRWALAEMNSTLQPYLERPVRRSAGAGSRDRRGGCRDQPRNRRAWRGAHRRSLAAKGAGPDGLRS